MMCKTLFIKTKHATIHCGTVLRYLSSAISALMTPYSSIHPVGSKPDQIWFLPLQSALRKSAQSVFAVSQCGLF